MEGSEATCGGAARSEAAHSEAAHEDPALPGWGWAEAIALAAGWGFALAVLLPAAVDGGPGRRAAVLSLAAALAFWPLAVVVVRSDLLRFLIPDAASAALAALGLVDAAALAWLAGEGLGGVEAAVFDAAATGAGAFALFWAVAAGFRATGRDALGHGDVKLAGALALWLSPADAALALELAALAAVAVLVAGHRNGARPGTALRDTAVPFGAFLAPAAFLIAVAAPALRDAGWLP